MGPGPSNDPLRMDDLLLGLLITVGGIGFLVYFFFGSFAYGAGFEPTPSEVVDSILRAVRPSPTDTFMDLGAGTGGIAFRVARECEASVVAVEREPIRYGLLLARRRCSRTGSRVTVRREDLFRTSIRAATIVFFFLWPSAVQRLRPRLESELSPGTRVVSYYHPIVGWTPVAVERGQKLYVYRVPESVVPSLREGGT